MKAAPRLRAEVLAECQRLIVEWQITGGELTAPLPFKFTVGPCLGYDPRYQLPPGVSVFGAGFAAIGVGRDLDSGRAWETMH